MLACRVAPPITATVPAIVATVTSSATFYNYIYIYILYLLNSKDTSSPTFYICAAGHLVNSKDKNQHQHHSYHQHLQRLRVTLVTS